MDTEYRNQNLKLAGVFFIGVVVGAFSIWMWTATQDALSVKEAEREVVTTGEIDTNEQVATVQDFDANDVQLRSEEIVVASQPAGLTVVIEKAVFEEDGWVVIHEGTTSHIGNALGATRFDKGEHRDRKSVG